MGRIHRITWDSDNILKINAIRIYRGNDYWTIASNLTNNPGYYEWTVGLVVEGDYRIYVEGSDYYGHIYTDFSDNYFSIIYYPSITLISPNGGEEWESGKAYRIIWDSIRIEKIDLIEVLRGDQVFKILLSTLTDNLGYYDWTIGPEFPIGSDYRIFVSGVGIDGYPYGDHSDGYFSIIQPPPSITIISPNGGEQWAVGQTYQIEWVSENVTNVDISMYQIGPEGERLGGSGIATVPASEGYYNWQIPSSSSGNWKIVISQVLNEVPDGGIVAHDESDNYFTIVGL